MSHRHFIEDDLGNQHLEARWQAARNFAPKQSNSWKPGLALQIEIERFIRVYGIDFCALLTLLFATPDGVRHMTPKEAQKVFKKAARHFFGKHFKAYTAVLDFHRSGAVHLHLVVALHVNIRDGWDFAVDQQHRDLRDKAKKDGRRMTKVELELARALSRRMTRNRAVKDLFATLRRQLPVFGFPKQYPFELKPVRNPGGLARYLAGRYRESRASKFRPPHSWCRRFSKGYVRCVDKQMRFSPVGQGATLYRRKKATVGAAFGIHNIGEMIERFGPRWEHDFQSVLQPLNPYDALGFFQWQMDDLRARVEARQPHHPLQPAELSTGPGLTTQPVTTVMEPVVEGGTNVPSETSPESCPSGRGKDNHVPRRSEAESGPCVAESGHMGQPDGHEGHPAVAISPRNSFPAHDNQIPPASLPERRTPVTTT